MKNMDKYLIIITILLMDKIWNTDQRLIKRYAEKKIINPSSMKSPITSILDITEYNALLELTKLRIPVMLSKLRARIQKNDNKIYNQTMLVKSEMYEFSKGKFIANIKAPYKKVKQTCESMSMNARLPTPTSKEVEALVELIKEMKVTAQVLPGYVIATDLVMVGNGYSLIDEPEAKEFFKNIFYLNAENEYATLSGDTAQAADGQQICLIDKQTEKMSNFHQTIFKENVKIMENLLTEISHAITDLLSARSTPSENILNSAQKYKVENSFRYLDYCLSQYNIDNIIFDPEEICIRKLRKILSTISSHGSVMNKRKPLIKNEYEDIKITKLSENTIKYTVLNPTVTSGTIYEFINTQDSINKLPFPFFLYSTDQTCSLIHGLPELDGDNVIVRNTRPLDSKCCYSLMFEQSVDECLNDEKTELMKDYLPISMHNTIISYYVTIGISIVAFIVSIITSYLYIRRRVKNTTWYKIRDLKRKRKKQRQERELNNEENAFEMAVPFVDNQRNIVPRYH